MHRAVAKIDPQIPFDHDERLVSVFVIIPDEVSLQIHDLELIIVHLGDHFWLPLLVEQTKLLHKS
jgi:methyl coenzyme M reductase subunit C